MKGFRGRVTGTRGALTTVLGQPIGSPLLLGVVVGLLGYAWRILQGLFDPDRPGNNWRGLAVRASFVARGALHAVTRGWGVGGGRQPVRRGWTRREAVQPRVIA